MTEGYSVLESCPGTICRARCLLLCLTLTLDLREQMFQMTHLLMAENNYAHLH